MSEPDRPGDTRDRFEVIDRTLDLAGHLLDKAREELASARREASFRARRKRGRGKRDQRGLRAL